MSENVDYCRRRSIEVAHVGWEGPMPCITIVALLVPTVTGVPVWCYSSSGICICRIARNVVRIDLRGYYQS